MGFLFGFGKPDGPFGGRRLPPRLLRLSSLPLPEPAPGPLGGILITIGGGGGSGVACMSPNLLLKAPISVAHPIRM